MEAIRNHPDFQLVGVCDSHNNLLAETAKQFKCKAFDCVDSMLENVNLDALVLCLPHNEYVDVIDKAFSKQIHVLKEKPLARNIAEAQTFLSKAREHEVKLGVAAQRRFHPTYQLAKEKLALVGIPQCVRIVHSDNKPKQKSGWRSSKTLAGGGALLDIGYHMLDIATWFFGKPEQVYISITQGEVPETWHIEEVEETALVIMELPKLCICQLFVSRQSSPKSEEFIINGSRGHMQISRTQIQFLSRDGAVLESGRYNPDWAQAMNSQLDDFFQLLNGHEDSLTSAQSHLSTLEVIQTICDCATQI